MKLPWAILVLALLLPTAGALVYFVAANPDDPLFRITYTISKVDPVRVARLSSFCSP